MCPPDLRSDASPFPPQVFYHLGELNDALNYALCAGSLFDVSETTDFVQTLLGTRANPQNVPARNRLFPIRHPPRSAQPWSFGWLEFLPGGPARRQVVLEADVTPLSLAPPRTSLNSKIHRRVHRAALEARG